MRAYIAGPRPPLAVNQFLVEVRPNEVARRAQHRKTARGCSWLYLRFVARWLVCP